MEVNLVHIGSPDDTPHGGPMRRLMLLLVAVVVLTTGMAEAQPRLGVLLFGTPATDPNVAAFRRGLSDLGYVEGRNIVLEYRYAEGKAERLPDLARELVSLKPNIIFALGGDVAPAVKSATATIPVVVSVSLDPVQAGLVGGLGRPSGCSSSKRPPRPFRGSVSSGIPRIPTSSTRRPSSLRSAWAFTSNPWKSAVQATSTRLFGPQPRRARKPSSSRRLAKCCSTGSRSSSWRPSIAFFSCRAGDRGLRLARY